MQKLFSVKSTIIKGFKHLFPSLWDEWILFLLFFIGYGLMALINAQSFTIIFNDRIAWDAYFSFDNRAVVMTGGSYEKHPFSQYLFDGIRTQAFLGSSGQKDATFRTILALLSTLAVSLSIVQVYKYLKIIITLPKGISFVLSLLFGCFSTCILLSFTPETYPYSMLFLLWFNYYAALKLKYNQPLSFSALSIGGILIGGITITNLIKVYIPVVFEKGLDKNWKKALNPLMKVGASLAIFITLWLWRIGFDISSFLAKSGTQLEKFSQAQDAPWWDMVYSWFWGGNMVFPSFFVVHHPLGHKAILMTTYTSMFHYMVMGLVFVLMVWSYIINFKNRLVQVLMLSFLVDVLIHTVLKFGLHTAYIYGGHFIFIVPLMLGWLYHAYHKTPQIQHGLLVCFSLLFVYIVSNNLYRMGEFFEFLYLYYQ